MALRPPLFREVDSGESFKCHLALGRSIPRLLRYSAARHPRDTDDVAYGHLTPCVVRRACRTPCPFRRDARKSRPLVELISRRLVPKGEESEASEACKSLSCATVARSSLPLSPYFTF